MASIRSYLIRQIVLTVLPVTLFATILAIDHVVTVRDERAEDAVATAHNAALAVDRYLESILASLGVLADTIEVESLPRAYAQATSFVAHHGTTVILVRPDGQQLLNTRVALGTPLPKTANTLAMGVFATGHTAVSDVYVGALARRQAVSVTAPVVRDGRVVYVLNLGIELEKVAEVISRIALPGTWSLEVVDGTGRPIAATGAAPATGEDRRAIEARTGAAGWRIVVGLPEAEMTGPVLAAALAVAASMALSLSLTVLTVVPGARRLSRGIGALAAFDDCVQAPPSGIAEIDAAAARLAQARQATERMVGELREAKAAAERASVARTTFIASASHDLRQPVQSLMLLIEVLRGQVAGGPVAKIAEHMNRALEGLRMLLDGILDISKLDAGVVTPNLQPVDLAVLLGRLAQEYRLRGADQGLQVRFVSATVWVQADHALLERVLRNLIENALRYTKSGKVLVGVRRLGATIRLDVIDTGIGIPPESLSRIFEEFYQLGNAARDRSQGLGLGLAIVQRTVALLNGRLEVSSIPGRGSRFSVILPALAEAQVDRRELALVS